MKVALVIHSFKPEQGGAERMAFMTARELSRRGNEVHILCIDGISSAGIEKHALKVRKSPSFYRYTSFAKEVRRMLKAERFDIVLSFTRIFECDVYRMGGGTHAGFLEATVEGAGRRALKKIFSLRDRANLSLEKSLFDGGAKHVIAVSERAREEAISFYGCESSKITVIRNPVDTNEFSPERRAALRAAARNSIGLASDEKAVVFCGSGFERKGLGNLIKAFASAAKKLVDMRLIVVGKGAIRPFQKLAQRNGVGSKIVFAGHQKDVVQFYAAADAFVLPSLYDPYPNAVLEAMACGIPVAVSRVTGVSEVIENGVNGFVIENASDVNEICGAILKIFDEHNSHVGGNAAATMKSYTVADYGNALTGLFEKVLSGRRC